MVSSYSLLAQVARNPLAGMSWVHLLIAIIVIAGICIIAWIGLRAMGVVIPQWFIQILWVIAIVIVVVIAIMFLASLF